MQGAITFAPVLARQLACHRCHDSFAPGGLSWCIVTASVRWNRSPLSCAAVHALIPRAVQGGTNPYCGRSKIWLKPKRVTAGQREAAFSIRRRRCGL